MAGAANLFLFLLIGVAMAWKSGGRSNSELVANLKSEDLCPPLLPPGAHPQFWKDFLGLKRLLSGNGLLGADPAGRIEAAMLSVDRRWYAASNAYEDSPQFIGVFLDAPSDMVAAVALPIVCPHCVADVNNHV